MPGGSGGPTAQAGGARWARPGPAGVPAAGSRPEASCFDMNRSTVASGVSIPDFPFQNRPTFQQVVQVAGHAPR